MPRTLSWLDHIHPIARTVAGSARSHDDRRDLEKLFSIQPRSAQNLMAALPTVPVGRARLVERETLSGFLATLEKAEDPAQTYAELRSGREAPSSASSGPWFSRTSPPMLMRSLGT